MPTLKILFSSDTENAIGPTTAASIPAWSSSANPTAANNWPQRFAVFLTVLQRSHVGQQKYEADYTSQVATIPLTHAVIAAVENQPRARSHPLTVNSP